MKTKSGVEYEVKALSLSEREICNNGKATIIDLKKVVLEDIFTITLRWVRYGLKSLNGVEINDDNRDEQINTLSDAEIEEISSVISTATKMGFKKKS